MLIPFFMSQCLFAAFFFVGPGHLEAQRTELVISTDCGVETDDQWALLHLALCERELAISGVIGAHAPKGAGAPAEAAERSARETLRALPERLRPAIAAGSNVPLESADQPRRSPGLDLLLERSRKHTPENRLAVVMIGPATDVASALLTDPGFADRVRVLAMAFNSRTEGGDVWNVKNDIKAWRVVLSSRIPLVVGDAEICKARLGMSVNRAKTLFPQDREAGLMLTKTLADWLGRSGDLAKRTTGDPETWPIWDEVATAHLLGFAKTERLPRPALRDDMTFDFSKATGTMDWIVSVDDRALWEDLSTRIRELHARTK